MKKILILIALASQVSMAQSDKFTAAMASTLGEFRNAKTNEQLAAVEAKFERIATAEKNQWLPYYYASNIKSIMSFSAKEEDKKETLADQAILLSEKADSINPKNSEIACIKALAQTAKMVISPSLRFMTNGSKKNDYIADSKKYDPTNPRPYVIEAQNVRHTPAMFGGGCENAIVLAKKSLELFAKFVPKNELAPRWGKDQAEDIVNNCKE